MSGSAAAQDSVRTSDSTTAAPDLATLRPVEPVPEFAGVAQRYTFTRDSLIWSSSVTLADLLERIPGVYVGRTGFTGVPEYVFYAGRGASSLEIFWDGQPYVPLGADTTWIDPSLIALWNLRRVDVEALPGVLRVHLVTEWHGATEPRSQIHIVTGDFDTGGYSVLFQDRWENGLGVDVGVDFLSLDGASGPGRRDQRTDLWFKASWRPTANSGAAFQIRRQRLESDAVPDVDNVPSIAARDASRSDVSLVLSRSSRAGGRGLRFRFGLQASAWLNDSLVPEQNYRTSFASLGYSTARMSATVTARIADRWLDSEYEGRIGAVLLPGIAVSLTARRRELELDRTEERIHATVTLYRGPVFAEATWTTGDVIQSISVPSDTAVAVTDRAVRVGLRTSLLEGWVGMTRRDAFEPAQLDQVAAVAILGPTPEVDYLEVKGTLRPTSYLSLDGWYAHPDAELDFQPPNHGRVQLTFRSKFWRTFRSGAFDMMFQVSMNSWSRGRAGFTADGLPVELLGISFYETYLQFRLVGFIAYWSLRNAYNSRDDYVPGLNYPTNAQRFGVRWEFSN